MQLRKSIETVSRVLTGLTALLLVVCSGADVEGQQRREMFTQAQKIGYLGQTSRSAMARNVLERLKTQGEARLVTSSADRILLWHEILLDSIAIDHTPDPDSGEVALDNGGPTRTSRALAMTQIAVFDAVNSFEFDYVPYADEIDPAPNGASIDAAIAVASFTVQEALYPEQRDRLERLLESDLAKIDADEDSILEGEQVGEEAAEAILDLRDDDNSDSPEPDFGEGGAVADGKTTINGTPVNGGTTLTFEWEPDPLTPPAHGDFRLALGAHWGVVTPFSIDSGDQFRSELPPEPGSSAYVEGFSEVQFIGASKDTEGSQSTPMTRFVGNYWGYDGTPLLGTPPRLYNQIAVQVAFDQGINDPVELARYLAIINTALADCGIAAWDSKYFYNYWRPVTGIRRSDGVPETKTNPDWIPVGISVINTEFAIRPTPPFPAYPSGHSTFGATTFEVMRQFFGNQTRFTFVSDEYNGQGDDPLGVPRPLVPVRFQSLQEAQLENGISRIYNGVHWQWDNIAGQVMGEEIGQHVVFDEEAFQPTDVKVLPGDVNGDGEVTLLDVAPFVELLINGDFQIEADINGDGEVTLLDVQPFVELLTGSGGQ